YPAGVDHLGEGLVGADSELGSAEFSWADVRQGGRQMLWLQRFIDPPERASRRVEVVDSVDAGPLGDGYQLLVGRCRQDGGQPDPEIAGMVRFAGEEEDAGSEDGPDSTGPAGDQHEFSSDVRSAWRLDRQSGRIEPVAVDGLRCQSLGD